MLPCTYIACLVICIKWNWKHPLMKLKCQSVQAESFRGSCAARRTDESSVQRDNICAKATPRRRTNVRYCTPAFPQNNFPLTLSFVCREVLKCPSVHVWGCRLFCSVHRKLWIFSDVTDDISHVNHYSNIWDFQCPHPEDQWKGQP